MWLGDKISFDWDGLLVRVHVAGEHVPDDHLPGDNENIPDLKADDSRIGLTLYFESSK